MLIDTHCHLHFQGFNENREEVIKRAHAANVRMITVGTKKRTSEDAVALAEKYEGMWATVGLHPNHLFPYPLDVEEEVIPKPEAFDAAVYRELANAKKVVAIGECGLDYYRIEDKKNLVAIKTKQQEIFRAQLDLAHELQLPVVVHCRDAHADLVAILIEYIKDRKLARRGVIHCFTGTIAEAEAYLPLGFLVSFTGIITFPPRKDQTEALTDVVQAIPLNRMMIETDAPYLAPIPFRGKQNEPAYVKHVAEKVAEVKGVSFEAVATQTTKNAEKLFRI
jgi:TatD DNase family protein